MNFSLEDMEGELWLPITGYENYYCISNMGRAKSVSRLLKMPHSAPRLKPENIMVPGCTWNGYLYVNLYRDNKYKTMTIHRLVALHFIDNPEGFKIVDHKFGNKKDNRASELRWTTSSINNKSAYDLGLKVSSVAGKTGSNSPSSKPINQYDKNGSFIHRFLSQAEASDTSGVCRNRISATANGIQKTAGGFVWRFDT